MAPAASVNAARRVHIRDFALLGNVRVLAGGPIVVNRVLRPGMTAAADRRRQIDPRQHGQVKIIGRVVGRRAVTILALHALQPRGGRRAAESGRRFVAHGVAVKIGVVGSLRGLECVRMWSGIPRGDGGPMALGAGRNTAIERCRASDAEKITAGGGGDGGPLERGGGAHGLPTSVLERALMVKLVVARRTWRPVPRNYAQAIGGVGHSGQNRPPGHTPGLWDGQMRSLRIGRLARRTQNGHCQTQDQWPAYPEWFSAGHKPLIVLPQIISAWRRQMPASGNQEDSCICMLTNSPNLRNTQEWVRAGLLAGQNLSGRAWPPLSRYCRMLCINCSFPICSYAHDYLRLKGASAGCAHTRPAWEQVWLAF